ncbi:MAG: primosomal protein N' [Treponemataceae bacterium]|nr:primosomal protein N' [Spirochaetales bacterium]MDY6030381.1 primosomal protein N' [Treponemataceae bacterium]
MSETDCSYPAYIEVLVNLPLTQSFTYKNLDESDKKFCDTNKSIDIGYRVEVMFGSRKMTGCVIAVYNKLPEKCESYKDKIKKILRVIDDQKLFTSEQVALSYWISKFYLCSSGEALFSMIPSGKKEVSLSNMSFEEEASSFKAKNLSEEQRQAVLGILDEHSPSLYHYLYGQTGSGKTEVFLSAAEKILSQGKGVIYLVPEIGLTHQVIESVRERFGNTVAILHSGLTGSQKLTEWHRIMNKEARVVIGARSAIFAPVPDLGLIIIDEEHDSSYKSGNVPRYHARQVAMKRCSDLKIPLVMGSATPSVEAWNLMNKKSLVKHVLTKRLAGGKMPEIKVVDLSKPDELGRKTQGCISSTLEDEMRLTYQNHKQTILFLNRRGFSHFFKCNSCGYEMKCKNCSVSMTFHKRQNRLICHYCGWNTEVPQVCPECKSNDVGFFGFGTEYIESEVRSKFPTCVIERIDTDNLKSQDEFKEKLDKFRDGKIDILLGTQMVAKGLNFPNLRLVGVIMADTGLNLPDFRAAEKTFSLITQVAGRAGRFFPDGKVIVQSYSPSRSAIYYACTNQSESFYKEELATRELLNFPPYSRLIRLVFRSAIQENAEKICAQAFKILEQFILDKKVEPFDILGPSECPLSKISANFRYQLILRSNNILTIQKACAMLVFGYKNNKNVYIEVDVDPLNLL